MAEDAPGDVLRRLNSEGAKGIGQRIAAIDAFWADFSGRRAWGEDARRQLADAVGLAHRLAGSGGTFGFPHVSVVASALEAALAGLAGGEMPAGDALKQVDRLVGALQSAFLRGSSDGRRADDLVPPDGGAEERQAVCVVERAGQPRSVAALASGLGFAVATAEAAAAGGPPNIAALVVDASGEGGIEQAGPLLGRCPTILLTDHADLAVRLAAVRRGIDVVMETPVDPAELSDWLNSFTDTVADAPFSVLIVDDDELLANAYAAALRGAGMVVSVTTDPSAAPVLIGGSFPDLVLMDVQMPGINGIELAQVIRQSRRFLSLPIVFLSAERDGGRQLLARRFGGDDFISKPVDLERLVDLVRLRAARSRSLRSAMEHDSLTGLLNHGRFKDKLQHELERCRRTGGQISLAMIDIDRFKAVNDTFGHLAGDRVIRGVARTLRGRLRKIDLVGRYGGEEFGVILLDTPAAAARMAIDAVRRAFAAQVFEEDGRTFQATFSGGIASSRRYPDMNGLIAAADAMLYEAKRAGRNAIFVDGGAAG